MSGVCCGWEGRRTVDGSNLTRLFSFSLIFFLLDVCFFLLNECRVLDMVGGKADVLWTVAAKSGWMGGEGHQPDQTFSQDGSPPSPTKRHTFATKTGHIHVPSSLTLCYSICFQLNHTFVTKIGQVVTHITNHPKPITAIVYSARLGHHLCNQSRPENPQRSL